MSSVNVKHGIVTGEPGDQKWSRRVREGGLGKGPQGTSPRPYLSRPIVEVSLDCAGERPKRSAIWATRSPSDSRKWRASATARRRSTTRSFTAGDRLEAVPSGIANVDVAPLRASPDTTVSATQVATPDTRAELVFICCPEPFAGMVAGAGRRAGGGAGAAACRGLRRLTRPPRATPSGGPYDLRMDRQTLRNGFRRTGRQTAGSAEPPWWQRRRCHHRDRALPALRPIRAAGPGRPMRMPHGGRRLRRRDAHGYVLPSVVDVHQSSVRMCPAAPS